MLILRRRPDDSLQIGGTFDGAPTLFDAQGNPVEITIRILTISRDEEVRIGVACPVTVPVHREEVVHRIKREERAKNGEINGNVADPEKGMVALHG